jgi:hypothetical protein
MFVFCDLFKISLVLECRGYSKMKSVFKGYGWAKRLGTAALKQIVKKLLSIEIMIFHTSGFQNVRIIIRKILVTGSCLKQT